MNDMSELDEKLMKLVNKLPLRTGMLFGGSIIVKSGVVPQKDLYKIELPDKNNRFLIPERALSILSGRDLYELPGEYFSEPDLNPLSNAIRKFCEVFKTADQKDFEEYGREVLLEGIEGYRIGPDSDIFDKYNILWQDELFRTDLGQTGLKQTGEFLRSYGRLPYPNEDLKNPKSLCLFKEKMEVVIGSLITIPGRESEKLIVSSTFAQKNRVVEDKIYFVNSQKYQYFEPGKKQSWIFNVSVKDVPGCISSGLNKETLSALASFDSNVLSGRNINVFMECLKKIFVVSPLHVQVRYDKKIEALKFKYNNFPCRYYAKGFMPFLLATGRFPTAEEIRNHKTIKKDNSELERE